MKKKNHRKYSISYACSVSSRLLALGGAGLPPVHLGVLRVWHSVGSTARADNTFEPNCDDFHEQDRRSLGMEEHSLLFGSFKAA